MADNHSPPKRRNPRPRPSRSAAPKSRAHASSGGIEQAPAHPEAGGFRWTRQRREVFALLDGHRDHPTAAEIYTRVRETLPDISLATVYNCLETLVGAGLVKQVNFERGPSRYCPNQREHAHLYDETSGEIHDVELKPGVDLHRIFKLPRGMRITRAEISLMGRPRT